MVEVPMRVFKSKWFAKYAEKEHISDAKLCEAIRSAERGTVDADYGGGVIKQRIARSIILFRRGERSFFVFGFAKNEMENIDKTDEKDFKKLAAILLSVTDEELVVLVENGEYAEVEYNA
jgi:hypothetical protein